MALSAHQTFTPIRLFFNQTWKTPSIQCKKGSYVKNFVQQVGTSYNLFPLFVHYMHLNLPFFIVIIIVKKMSQSSLLPWELIKLIIYKGALFTLAHFKALRSTTSHFPSCLFPSIVDDTHIIGPLSIVSSAYEHFQTKFHPIGLSI